MKRRSKINIGQWPNMRDDTLKAIAGELVRARKKHPAKDGNLRMLELGAASLRVELGQHTSRRMTASQVYARAAQVAAMAVRLLEEGTAGFSYMGNTSEPPEFKLEVVANAD